MSLISQILVDENDEAFSDYTKPIGSIYSKEESEILTKEFNYVMKSDANRGYRRVVASLKPIELLDSEALVTLLGEGMIAIVAGGIPIIKRNDEYVGVDAVIDKDFATAKVAQAISADKLFILTAVDKIAINFGKQNQKDLDSITIEEARQYIQLEHFHKGSMLPKVEGAIEFVENNPNGQAIIASLQKAKDALQGKTGTRIIKQ